MECPIMSCPRVQFTFVAGGPVITRARPPPRTDTLEIRPEIQDNHGEDQT